MVYYDVELSDHKIWKDIGLIKRDSQLILKKYNFSKYLLSNPNVNLIIPELRDLYRGIWCIGEPHIYQVDHHVQPSDTFGTQPDSLQKFPKYSLYIKIGYKRGAKAVKFKIITLCVDKCHLKIIQRYFFVKWLFMIYTLWKIEEKK